MRLRRALTVATGVALTWLLAACASNAPKPAANPAAPAYSAFEMPVIPAELGASQEIRDRHEQAWRKLQAGDLRSASREFAAILHDRADFYPAETGLAYVEMADRDYPAAASGFRSSLHRNTRYMPALQGLVEAELALDHPAEAIAALERIVEMAPERDGDRTRLDVLRLKETQRFIDDARRARQAGHLDEARGLLENALNRAPSSAAILGELASLDVQRGSLETAELYAKRAVQADPSDALGHAALGAVYEARGRFRDAVTSYTTAAGIDPRWNEALGRVRDKADLGNSPKDIKSIESAPAVSRAEAAAFIGMRLEALIASAPRRIVPVATDIRQHWAEPWILAVAGAGVMEIQPNHTFQPAQAIRRDELTAILTVLIELAAAGKPRDLAEWKATRPKFVDLPEAHLFYSPAALAVASGVLPMPDDGRFQPTRLVTGAEFVRAITRIQQIAGK